MSELSSLITVMKGATGKAARILSRDFNELKSLQSSQKPNDVFVNRAFEKIKDKLIYDLEKARPEFGITTYGYTKESTSENEERWIVNILDGSKNFSHAIPAFAIGIAVEEKRYGKTEVISGFIYLPATNEQFFAEKGQGAWHEGSGVTRIRVSARKSKSSLLGVGEVAEVDSINFGSDLMACAYVACGRIDFAKLKTGYSEVAPGIIIVREAGGSVEESAGELVFSNSVLERIIK